VGGGWQFQLVGPQAVVRVPGTVGPTKFRALVVQRLAGARVAAAAAFEDGSVGHGDSVLLIEGLMCSGEQRFSADRHPRVHTGIDQVVRGWRSPSPKPLGRDKASRACGGRSRSDSACTAESRAE